jgi:hypothetical protein
MWELRNRPLIGVFVVVTVAGVACGGSTTRGKNDTSSGGGSGASAAGGGTEGAVAPSSSGGSPAIAGRGGQTPSADSGVDGSGALGDASTGSPAADAGALADASRWPACQLDPHAIASSVPFGNRRWAGFTEMGSTADISDARGYPRVALSASGHGIITWAEYDGARFHVWARRYEHGIGWQAAEQLDPPTPPGTPPLDRSASGVYVFYPEDALSPQPYVSPTGELFVTWLEGVGQIPMATQQVWVSQFRGGDGWTAGRECPCGQSWGFDDQGHAISVWFAPGQNGGGEIRANRLDPATGWGSPRALETIGDASTPALAVSGNGEALGAFVSSGNLEMQRYDPDSDQWSSTWQYADPGREYRSLNLGIDACGHGLIAWEHVEHEHDLVEIKSTWWAAPDEAPGSAPEPLASGDESISNPGPLFIMPSGRAAMQSLLSGGTVGILAREPRGEWGMRPAPPSPGLGPAAMEEASGAVARLLPGSTLLGMTNHGELLVVGVDSSMVLLARRYLAESGWDAPASLGQYEPLDLAILPTGEALLAVRDPTRARFSVTFLE